MTISYNFCVHKTLSLGSFYNKKVISGQNNGHVRIYTMAHPNKNMVLSHFGHKKYPDLVKSWLYLETGPIDGGRVIDKLTYKFIIG